MPAINDTELMLAKAVRDGDMAALRAYLDWLEENGHRPGLRETIAKTIRNIDWSFTEAGMKACYRHNRWSPGKNVAAFMDTVSGKICKAVGIRRAASKVIRKKVTKQIGSLT